MTSYAKRRCSVRDRRKVEERIEAWKEWSCKPLSGKAECVVSAVAGFTMFFIFFAVYLLTG